MAATQYRQFVMDWSHLDGLLSPKRPPTDAAQDAVRAPQPTALEAQPVPQPLLSPPQRQRSPATADRSTGATGRDAPEAVHSPPPTPTPRVLKKDLSQSVPTREPQLRLPSTATAETTAWSARRGRSPPARRHVSPCCATAAHIGKTAADWIRLEEAERRASQQNRRPSPAFRSTSPRFGHSGMASTYDCGCYVRPANSTTIEATYSPRGMGDVLAREVAKGRVPSPLRSSTPRFVPSLMHGGCLLSPVVAGYSVPAAPT